MRRPLHLLCVSTLLSTTILSTAHAEPIPNETEENKKPTVAMDTVTVYATRSEQSTFDVPAMVSQVDAEAPGNATAGDVEDLLEFTPGVEVDNGPRRNGQVVSIRGFDDAAIITLIDGRRQNFEAAHDGRFYIDPSLLKSVEVVKGASSAIYGGGAIGGVLAFETKDAADLLAPGESMGATTSFGYRSGNNEYSPSVTGFARSGGWDIVSNLSYRDSGDIEQGDGNTLDTEDNVLSGLFKAGYAFGDFHSLEFGYQGLTNNGQEPNNGAGAITTSNPIVNKEVVDHQYSVKYAFEDPGNALWNPKLHAYFNDTDVEETDLTGANAGRIQDRRLHTIGFTADNQSRIIEGDTHGQTLSYGFEIYNDKQVGTSNLTGTRAGVPNAEATNYGVYLQDEISFDTSAGKFLVIPAARFDAYKSDDELGNSQNENEVSPKLSASYMPTEELMLFGSWARAFRAPNLTELYPTGLHFPGVFPFFPDNVFIPNPDLMPETVTTIEFGAGVDFDDVFTGGDRAKVKGSWFSSDGKDFITQVIDIGAGTAQNVNIPNAKLSGYEVEGTYQLHPVTARFGVSYVKAEDDDTGEYLTNNVPITFVADISYQADALDSTFGWRSRFADENDRVGAADAPTAGYGVHDIYYRWTPDEPGLESFTLDLGVENIFDKAYTKRFATLLEEGRSYVGRVHYRW